MSSQLSLLALLLSAVMATGGGAQTPALVGHYKAAWMGDSGTEEQDVQFSADGSYRWENTYTGDLNAYAQAALAPGTILPVDLGKGVVHVVFQGTWSAQDTLLTTTGTTTEFTVDGTPLATYLTTLGTTTSAQMVQQLGVTGADAEALIAQVQRQFEVLGQLAVQRIYTLNVIEAQPFSFVNPYPGSFPEHDLYVSYQPGWYLLYDRVDSSSAISGTTWAQVKAARR